MTGRCFKKIDLINPPVSIVDTPTLTSEETFEVLRNKFKTNPDDDIELPVRNLTWASIKGDYNDFL